MNNKVIYVPSPDPESNSDVFTGEASAFFQDAAKKLGFTAVDSPYGFEATILDVALKDAGCPVGIKEFLDVLWEGIPRNKQIGDPVGYGEALMEWHDKIEAETRPEVTDEQTN